ncbi:MAG: elongation factor P [Candidatus Moranbacteria bacterium CG23_combo_of_CG06-09_8_20_14_all_39_10]|nr:MAG: elongation factor P [Candidatus Moranbacteria bacterium CG23_combo_of_CG06-09_8_20_14_all_39_10]
MLNISDIKTGKNIVHEKAPFVVLFHEQSKTGRAGSVLRTKLKNLITGAVLEKTFQGADQLEEADINKSKAQFLYKEGEDYAFMDNESYEQFTLPKSVLDSATDFLTEGTAVVVLNFNNLPINIEIPAKVTLKVIDAPPGIKGNTVSTGGKVVTLETGLRVSAPLFVNEGDKIIVNTERGEYVSRA